MSVNTQRGFSSSEHMHGMGNLTCIVVSPLFCDSTWSRRRDGFLTSPAGTDHPAVISSPPTWACTRNPGGYGLIRRVWDDRRAATTTRPLRWIHSNLRYLTWVFKLGRVRACRNPYFPAHGCDDGIRWMPHVQGWTILISMTVWRHTYRTHTYVVWVIDCDSKHEKKLRTQLQHYSR